MSALINELRSDRHREPVDPKAVYRTRRIGLFKEAADRLELLEWSVEWLIAQAKDERLTLDERVGIIAHFPSERRPDEARATTERNDRTREGPK